MALNLAGRGAIVALLVVVAAASQVVSGNFADAAGFSGRAGVTCLACHTVAPVGHVEAQAELKGLPEAWDPGQTYRLDIAVLGGPAAMPAPAPQGGFDLDVGAGRLVLPAGTEDQLRLVGEHEATYKPAGTLMRAWSVDWVAPGLEQYPAPVPVWLAVMAANGNHVIALNGSDGGERFDSTAALQASVPPSPAALAAWRALPLAPPTANATRADGAWVLEGRHADGNASRLLWSVDGGPWQAKDTATAWRLELAGLDGDHRVALRSEGRERSSPDTVVPLAGPPGLLDKVTGGKSAPLPPALPLLALALLAIARKLSP